MEYVGLKMMKKDFRGRAACFGAVEAYSRATGLFRVAYDGDHYSEEMQLEELYPLFLFPPPPPGFGGKARREGSSGIGGDLDVPRDSGRNFDLNVCAEIDLNDGVGSGGDCCREGGGLHGLDLNEGVNYILHDEFDFNGDEIGSAPKTREIDLNLDLSEEAEEASTSDAKTVRWFDLNVELKEDQFEEPSSAMAVDDKGKAAVEEDDDDCVIVPAPLHVGSGSGSGGGRRNRTNSDVELRRNICMSPFTPQDYALFAAGVYSRLLQFQPPPPAKAELPPSSTSLNLGGASLLDFLSVYAFLRSFSVSLLISPFEIDELAAALVSNDSTPLFDAIHLALLTALRLHLRSLSDEGCESASVCLRSLNWDFLDLITWPVFLIEYLFFHSPKHIPGLDLDEFEPFQSEYYTMPASAKVAVLQHLCDDVVESETLKAEVDKRGLMAESQSWNSRYFSCKAKNKKKKGRGNGGSMVEECLNDFVDDGNGDECYLCKTDGNLICCDGCPAAFHARCVGVVSSLLPDGDWFCPECTIDRGTSYKLSKSLRGVELLGTDAYARHYYNCCGYLLVADSCEGEYSFSLYRKDDIPAVVAALEASSSVYDKIASAIRRNWNLARGVYRMPNEANHVLPSAERRMCGGTMENQLVISSEGSTKVCQDNTNLANEMNHISSNDSQIARDLPNPRDGGSGASTSRSASEIVVNYVNFYGFARMSSLFSKELASKWSDEDTMKSAEQIIGRQMRVISNKYAAFSWSNLRDLSLNTRREKCGWCFCCKFPDLERDCLFITSDDVRASETFTSQALGIMPGDSRKNHLVDVICHVIWIEDRLHGLLSGPWSDPSYSGRWRKTAMEAAHIGYLKYLLLQLESSLHRRALSAEWTKSVDSAATIGSAATTGTASHNVRRVPRRPEGSRGKRKCSKHEVAPTPKDEQGASLSWWRGGRASRELFNWKALPRALASSAARKGGYKKIEGVCYPDSGEYAKRTKCLAWSAAVEALKTVEQLALQVRQLDASIKWNAIGNINLLPKPEKESRKAVKSFKGVVIQKRRHDEGVLKYLLDFGKSTLIPDIVVRHGSLAENCSSRRNKYWLEETHVPLHLLKAYGERRLARASKKGVLGKPLDEGGTTAEPPAEERKKGFEYLFQRAERLEKSTCEHCTKSVLIREAVSCQFCKGLFHRNHARESETSSSSESPLFTCHRCWEKELLQRDCSKEDSLTGRKKRRRARRGADPEKDLWSAVDNKMRRKRRGVVNSSYWLNGLRISRRTDDERLVVFRSKMLLVLPGGDAPVGQNPRCSICGELEREPGLSYVACEICGAWFHGDALDLSAERIQSIIAFECHKCLHKTSPVCPHQRRQYSAAL